MIVLQWRLHHVIGASYYYTYHKGKFWCVKADHVHDGKVEDTDFIFQVTISKMDEKTKKALLERLMNLFPEINLEHIKKSLHYDKNIKVTE